MFGFESQSEKFAETKNKKLMQLRNSGDNITAQKIYHKQQRRETLWSLFNFSTWVKADLPCLMSPPNINDYYILS